MHREMASAVVLALLAVAGPALAAAAQARRHVEAELVAETDAVTPGRPLMAGLRLRMEPGWHTYWRNPGDSGLPTKVKWDLPSGFAAGEILWPSPIRFNTGPLVSYGYHDEVLLPVRLEVPDRVPSDEVRLKARVSWLECRDVCLPGKADLELTLPVRSIASPGPAAALFGAARRALPEPGDGWTFSLSTGAAGLVLAAAPPLGTKLQEAYFYPATPRVLDYSKPQDLRTAGGGYVLALPLDPNAAAVERLEGVLVGRTDTGPVALAVDVALK